MSNTGPGEIARIKELSGGDERWEQALTSLAILTERSEQALNWQRVTDEWRANHDRSDAEKFASLNVEVKSLKDSLGGVSSTVQIEKDGNRYTLRQMVGGFLGLCGILGMLFGAIAWMISNAGKGAP